MKHICLLLLLLPAMCIAADRQSFPLRANGTIPVWIVAGPLPNEGSGGAHHSCKGYFRDYLTAAGGERNVTAAEGDIIQYDNEKITWKYAISDTSGLLDYIDIFNIDEQTPAVAYAFCQLFSDKSQKVKFGIRSDDGVRVWLNTDMIHDHHIGRGVDEGEDVVTIKLKKGSNRLMVKVDQGSGGWGLLLRLVGLDEKPVIGVSSQAALQTQFDVSIQPEDFLFRENGKLLQSVRFNIVHLQKRAEGIIYLGDNIQKKFALETGLTSVQIKIPEINNAAEFTAKINVNGQQIAERTFTVHPVPKLEIYFIPHSHTDIGYTDIQTEVERQHIRFIDQAFEIIDSTAAYPEGARYKWNIEVSWAVDAYMRTQSAEKQKKLVQAIKEGHIGVEGLYTNVLSGLCRPEELLRLFSYSGNFSKKYGVPPIESAMISDIPGYTWGMVSAMTEAGIKYFSPAPNYFDRIGTILATWEDKLFYWAGPSSDDKILVWIPYFGYGLSHTLGNTLTDKFITGFLDKLRNKKYPYDITYLRWSGLRDNWGPEPQISEFIKEWNSKYAFPKLKIATTVEVFKKFEQQYGDKLPVIKGDWTPYWEDGAASSARETAINRAAAERLVQAEALWAMLKPSAYPKDEFYEAWKNVLLYSEHTWGADISVIEPESKKTKEQWQIKQAFALNGEEQSRKLVDKVFQQAPGELRPSEMDVFNVNSWPRTDLVCISADLSKSGDRVIDQNDHPVLSQRLSTGELAFVAENVPPFAAKRYKITSGEVFTWDSKTKVAGTHLKNGIITMNLEKSNGNIIGLYTEGHRTNFVDSSSADQLNEYIFLPGKDIADIQKSGKATITVKENGPLIVSLLVESDAPGCKKLTREIRLIDGFNRVDIINTVDKKRAELKPNPGNWDFARTDGKEGLHFAFPFNIPQGLIRIDIPFAIMMPEKDQIPSACKNWFSVQRWIDISNDEAGITWANLDAPLVEIGEISGNILGNLSEQRELGYWRSRVEPTQKFYSWVMNNHWHTNYKAYQEGLATFRYSIRPHKKYDVVEAARFGMSFSQPLITAPAKGEPVLQSLLSVEPAGVIVTSLQPSEDGQAYLLRLFNICERPEPVSLNWKRQKPLAMYLSSLFEDRGRRVEGEFDMPAYGIVTIRAEMNKY